MTWMIKCDSCGVVKNAQDSYKWNPSTNNPDAQKFVMNKAKIPDGWRKFKNFNGILYHFCPDCAKDEKKTSQQILKAIAKNSEGKV